MIQDIKQETEQFVLDLTTKDKLYIILLAAAIVRSAFLFVNFDSTVYQMWLEFFLKTGDLPYYDHPPLFFILTGAIELVFRNLQQLNSYIYFTMFLPIFYGIYRYTKDRSVFLFALLSYLLVYISFIGYMGNIYEIGALASMLSGVGFVYITYLIGAVESARTGIYAALFTAFAWWPIVYSNTLLIDMFASLMITVSYFVYYKLINAENPSRKLYMVSGSVLTLAFYSKYYALLMCAPILIYGLYVYRNDFQEFLIRMVPAGAALGIFGIWALYTDLYLIHHYASTHYLFLNMPGGLFFASFFYKALTPLLVVLFLYGLLRTFREDIDLAIFLGIPVLLGVIFHLFQVFVLRKSHSLINLSNYMLYSFPLIAILASKAWQIVIEEAGNRRLITIFLVLTLLPPILGSSIDLNYDDSYETPNYNFNTLSESEFIRTDVPDLEDYSIHYSYKFQKNVQIWSSYNRRISHFRWLNTSTANIISLEPVYYKIKVESAEDTNLTVLNDGKQSEMQVEKSETFYIRPETGIETYRFSTDSNVDFSAVQHNCAQNPEICDPNEESVFP